MISESQIQTIQLMFDNMNMTITNSQSRQFARYYEMLVEKNEVMNLTAITEFNEVLVKHFLDSCWLWKILGDADIERVGTMIDVGTGAGFPGVPLKIVRPETELFLLDALQKRIDFLEEVGAAIDLTGVTCEHNRAEDGAKDHRESFDLAVSRAVSKLSVLSEYCLPYVKVGGLFAAYKSGDIDEELKEAGNALKILGGEVDRVERFTLPDGSPRSIVLIRKVCETPAKYPRKAGKPMKSPL